METWKQVVGFPGYEVSDLGRMRSWKPCPRLGNELPRLMVPGPGTNGYLHVVLMRDGKQWTKSTHTVVLEAFVGPCPEGMECRHYPDATRSNNTLANLSWATVKDNAHDRIFMGTQARGDANGARLFPERLTRGAAIHCAKLTDGVVSLMRWLNKAHDAQPATLARWTGVSKVTAQRAISGETWAHVPAYGESP